LFDSKSASDVHRRIIAVGHHPVMVTLVGQECGWPVLPSTHFSWRHFSLPILVQRIGNLDKLDAILDLFQQFQRGEILDAVRRGIAHGLEQVRRYQNGHIMQLSLCSSS
jgi:hypothetical protein